jgi:hypothetical protein
LSLLYNRVFAYASLQFCGHIEAYCAAHTRELAVFIVQPRVGLHQHVLRRYHDGQLIEERPVRSSQFLFLYYLLWYLNHVRILLNFCPRNETTIVFGGHPIVFFGMGILRRMRPLRYAYWIGDYFPSTHSVIRVFERIKKVYHRRVDAAFYLTDAINQMMNGTVVENPNRRTVMWGLKPFPKKPPPPNDPFTLLFVGLIRPGQGLENLFTFLVQNPHYRLKLIGTGQPVYLQRLQDLLQQLGLCERVFFPRRFYTELDLLDVAATCHVGLALYDLSSDNFTHYADPGKVKAYAEMHLPVIMTRISDIVPFIERYGSGEVIDRIENIGDAVERIRVNYTKYQDGIEQFIAHFECDGYYHDAFSALEDA